METNQKHMPYLQLLNVLTLAVILTTIAYSSAALYGMPDRIRVPDDLLAPDMRWISKSAIWGDIRLMVTTYLIISLICIYTQFARFKNGSGKSRTLMISFINLCIGLTFAITILSTVNKCCQP